MNLLFTFLALSLVILATSVKLPIAEIDSSKYDEALSKKLMTYCAVTYCRDTKIEKWNCGKDCNILKNDFELTQVFHNKTSKNHGFIGYDKSLNHVILAFAGTNPISIKEWIEDLNFPKQHEYPACSDCSVHEGFYYAYLSVAGQVVAGLQKAFAAHPDASLAITGHSLGASLSVLAAVDLVENHSLQPSLIYTYGTPRVGNKQFSTWATSVINAHMYHITHGRDPVPHLPPESFGFVHTPQEVFYKASVKKGYKLCDESGEDKDCSDKYLADIWVPDHLTYMDVDLTSNYLKCYVL